MVATAPTGGRIWSILGGPPIGNASSDLKPHRATNRKAPGSMNGHTLEYWIKRLSEGDAEAVEPVFRAYEPYLRIAVRRRLSSRLRTKVDSADIVQSVFADVLGGFRDGGWSFAGEAQFLAFLRRIAWRRLADCYQKHRRALSGERPLSETPSREHPPSRLPRPSQIAQGHELWNHLMEGSSPLHQEVVHLKSKGLKLAEIAARTGLHESSVRRILYNLARQYAEERKPGSSGHHEAE